MGRLGVRTHLDSQGQVLLCNYVKQHCVQFSEVIENPEIMQQRHDTIDDFEGFTESLSNDQQ